MSKDKQVIAHIVSEYTFLGTIESIELCGMFCPRERSNYPHGLVKESDLE